MKCDCAKMRFVFEIGLWAYFIVCPLTFLGGFIDSIAGGGGLITLPAYLVAGLPAHLSMGTNKVGSFFGALTATINFIREGYIKWKLAIPCAVLAIVGSACGTNLTLLIEADVLLIIIIVMLPISAVFTISSKGLGKSRNTFSYKKAVIICGVISFVIGAYDGFYGPGTGTFLIILFNFLAHLKLEEANGLSKAVNLSSNISALIVFLINGKVLLLLALFAGISQLIGSYIGSKLFINNGIKIVRPIMLIVFVLLLGKIIYDLLF